MWTKYPQSICHDVKGDIFKKECTAAAVFDSCALRFLNAEVKKYGLGHGANWHPTIAIHLLRGELIVWLYGLTLLDAMFTIQELLSDTSPEKIYKGKIFSFLNIILPDTISQLKSMKILRSDVKLLCNKDPLLCHGRAMCYTDYTPRYSDLSLEGIVVGSTKWLNHHAKIESPGQGRNPQDLESRPSYLSHHGPADGEIFFRVSIPSNTNQFNKILICGYKIAEHKEGIFGHVEYKVDINVKLSKNKTSGNFDYLPSENRLVWSSHTKETQYCHLLKDLPQGIHVIGLESKENKPTGVSHVITWREWG